MQDFTSLKEDKLFMPKLQKEPENVWTNRRMKEKKKDSNVQTHQEFYRKKWNEAHVHVLTVWLWFSFFASKIWWEMFKVLMKNNNIKKVSNVKNWIFWGTNKTFEEFSCSKSFSDLERESGCFIWNSSGHLKLVVSHVWTQTETL